MIEFECQLRTFRARKIIYLPEFKRIWSQGMLAVSNEMVRERGKERGQGGSNLQAHGSLSHTYFQKDINRHHWVKLEAETRDCREYVVQL